MRKNRENVTCTVAIYNPVKLSVQWNIYVWFSVFNKVVISIIRQNISRSCPPYTTNEGLVQRENVDQGHCKCEMGILSSVHWTEWMT